MTMIEKCYKLAEMIKINTREQNKGYKNLGESYFDARVVERTKYILIDDVRGGQPSGRYMVEKATGLIYAIKSAYGVINRKKCYGSLDEIEQKNWGCY